MHFTTLVTVEVPKLEPNAIVDLFIEKQLEQLESKQATSTERDIMLDIEIRRLRGLKTEFARCVEVLMYNKMEPYNEQTEDPRYLEFEDETEELRRQYETEYTDCIKLPNGSILPADNRFFWNKFCIHDDGKVYQKNFGQLKHDKRSKRAKKMTAILKYPYKKLYKSFEEFAEKGKGFTYNEHFGGYGYTYNPNAFYDWCVIGGRWPKMFLVKDDCEEYSIGERSWCNSDKEYEAPEGYHWVAAARKKDIQWQAMHEWEIESATKTFYKVENAYKTGILPEDWHCKIEDNKIFYFGDIVYIEGETLDAYLKRKNLKFKFKYPHLSYGFLDEDGYHEREEAWRHKKSRKRYNKLQKKYYIEWRKKLDSFIDSIPDETVIVGVDCHV